MKWHSGLPDRWDDVQDVPPLPGPVDRQEVDVIRPGSGVVWRSGHDWIHALDEDVVVDLEAAR